MGLSRRPMAVGELRYGVESPHEVGVGSLDAIDEADASELNEDGDLCSDCPGISVVLDPSVLWAV